MKHSVSLEELEFFAYHGVYPEENKIGNKYRIDITLELDLSSAIHSDEISDTVDYGQLYQLIETEVRQPSKLLEHIGGRIISQVLMQFPAVQKVMVSVYKHNPPIGGTSRWAKVTLHEER